MGETLLRKDIFRKGCKFRFLLLVRNKYWERMFCLKFKLLMNVILIWIEILSDTITEAFPVKRKRRKVVFSQQEGGEGKVQKGEERTLSSLGDKSSPFIPLLGLGKVMSSWTFYRSSTTLNCISVLPLSVVWCTLAKVYTSPNHWKCLFTLRPTVSQMSFHYPCVGLFPLNLNQWYFTIN